MSVRIDMEDHKFMGAEGRRLRMFVDGKECGVAWQAKDSSGTDGAWVELVAALNRYLNA